MIVDSQILTIHQVIENQVTLTPDRIAVVFQDHQLTYQELNEKANQLAHYLQKLGVGAETLVGICVERSLEMIVALLAILKAGGAYVPLDPSYPADRIALMVEDSQLPVLITQKHLLKNFTQYPDRIVCLEQDAHIIAQYSKQNPSSTVSPENLAYTIYTSGSTGKPKGVQIIHSAVVNFLLSMQAEPGLTSADIILAVTTISFDIAVLELFLPLTVGACTALVSREIASDPIKLAQEIAKSKPTFMQATPATWQMLLAIGWEGKADLKILCGGEAMTRMLANQLLERCGSLWNMYGPTETTIWSMIHKIEPGNESVPIGHAIANTQIYLLEQPCNRKNDPIKLVPFGVAGELYIGGNGLARGYLNRPELNRERFVRDPFSNKPNARLYRTGDLARYLPDGSIEFIDRVDRQVKIRGHRIELGEIEAALSQHPLVKESAVIAKENKSHQKSLVAYIAPKSDWQGSRLPRQISNLDAEMSLKWQQIWDTAYSNSALVQDPTFNISGWNNSYTGELIPANELQEWIDCTVARILELRPQKLLEIGCGTGLLLFRIAPQCNHYVSTDISPQAIDYIQQQLDHSNQDWSQVTLYKQPAHAIDFIEPQAFDTVVLNSVVQYFPSIHYLARVLETAVKAVKPGGNIFIGDVRNLRLLEAFHTSILLYQSSASLSTEQLKQRIQHYINQDRELVIDPEFFSSLNHLLPQISQVKIQLKRGIYHNEMTKFRYDVVLQVGTEANTLPEPVWLDWYQQEFTLPKIRDFLAQKQPERIGIKNIPNARISTEIAAISLLSSSSYPETVGDLSQNLQQLSIQPGIDPEDLWALAHDFLYHIWINWSTSRSESSYDVLFQKRLLEAKVDSWEGAPVANILSAAKPIASYANNPLKVQIYRHIVPQLRAFLKKKIPTYMIPSAFVIVDSLPLTPNGKIDRRALPAISQDRPLLDEFFVAPRNPIEEKLAAIWASILNIEVVGISDNFFDLGGNSLLVAQLISEIQDIFRVNLSLEYFFSLPTISSIAKGIANASGLQENLPIHSANSIDLLSDAMLDPEIYSDSLPIDLGLQPQHIFLTGATGFLGSFILSELLQQTEANIYCLVRAENTEEGNIKIHKSLQQYMLNHQVDSDRIIPIIGDLSSPLLGLSSQEFDKLANLIDVVYHSAAFVNLIYPYTALREANVLGTQEVLRLASKVKTKPVHFISTLDVFQTPAYAQKQAILEDEKLNCSEDLYNGYAQSKWVAEKLINIAQERGIPTCIYRLGMIVGHSQTGASKLEDLISRFIKGLIQLRSAPDFDLAMNLTPVDYVSRAIIYLSKQKQSYGKVYHLVNPGTLFVKDLVQCLQLMGYQVQTIPYAMWQKKLHSLNKVKDSALSPLASLFIKMENSIQLSCLETLVLNKVSCKNAIVDLSASQIKCPQMNASLINRYLSYFIQQGFINQP
jgi:amino acid adenylation domain-containing protein/thioester reductase-like protein